MFYCSPPPIYLYIQVYNSIYVKEAVKEHKIRKGKIGAER